jgi:hypothetical protein
MNEKCRGVVSGFRITNIGASRQIDIWSCRLNIYDSQGNVTQLQMEMRSLCGFNGSFQDGDEVELLEYDLKGGLYRVLQLLNCRTGTIVNANSAKVLMEKQAKLIPFFMRWMIKANPLFRQMQKRYEDPFVAWTLLDEN